MQDANQEEIALLESALEKTTSPQERLEQLNKLAIRLRFVSVERSRSYAEQALVLAGETGNAIEKARALRLIASAEDIANRPTEAMRLLHEAKSIAAAEGVTTEVIACNNTLGKVLMQLGDLPASLRLFQENAVLASQTGDLPAQADAILTEAVVHFRNNDFEEARKLFEKSLALARSIGYEAGVGRGLLNLSATYVETAEYEKGIEAAQEAIGYFERNGNKVDMAHACSNLGSGLCGLGRYEESIPIFMRVREIREGLNDVLNRANSYISIAEALLNLGRYEDALRDLLEGERLAIEAGNKLVQINVNEVKSRLYEAMGNYPEALAAHRKYHALTRELSSEERTRDLRNLRMRFEFDKLEKEKELYRLHSIEQEKANKQISEQKQVIEQKNKDITDSIHYARRIQDSLLPAEEELFALVPGCFVLYRPKDIVSGDFYWCAQQGNRILLVVADCTGHGVPGALMSMMGHNLLHQITAGNETISPAEILAELDRRLRLMLRQESGEEGGNDGMDIALCAIGEDAIVFAGARRPLYVLRAGEILEYKGSRSAVGGKIDRERVFTEERIVLLKGDCIFCFSDGYADQFGGPEGKKMQTARFKQIIGKLQPLSPGKRRAVLETEWLAWKGKLEQVDDVLVIGFEV